MSTFEKYTMPTEPSWQLPLAGDARFTWEYDEGRERLLNLYQKGKDKQWDATKRIDWDIEVDPSNVLGLPDETIAIYGTDMWNKLSVKEQCELKRHLASWQFSQFLHGEQGATIVAARIVESVPDLDAKFYAATQVMDEARHVETYARFLQEKVGVVYPINPQLQELLDDTLSDSRWDMPYLGMQVLIEGIALAAFGLIRDLAQTELPKQILAYVMQDEARHVAFGRMALKDYYGQLTDAERDEREEFVVEGCYLMRDRLKGAELWENWGFDVAACLAANDDSEYQRMFQNLLFTRIVPCVKDIGLWGERVQKAYADMGVLDYAGSDLSALMRQDEEIADGIDAAKLAAREEQALAARAAQIDETIAVGAQA